MIEQSDGSAVSVSQWVFLWNYIRRRRTHCVWLLCGLFASIPLRFDQQASPKSWRPRWHRQWCRPLYTLPINSWQLGSMTSIHFHYIGVSNWTDRWVLWGLLQQFSSWRSRITTSLHIEDSQLCGTAFWKRGEMHKCSYARKHRTMASSTIPPEGGSCWQIHLPCLHRSAGCWWTSDTCGSPKPVM